MKGKLEKDFYHESDIPYWTYMLSGKQFFIDQNEDEGNLSVMDRIRRTEQHIERLQRKIEDLKKQSKDDPRLRVHVHTTIFSLDASGFKTWEEATQFMDHIAAFRVKRKKCLCGTETNAPECPAHGEWQK